MAKMLIADDSRVHVHLLRGWLQERGFDVIEALDAVQAWMKGLRSQATSSFWTSTCPEVWD